MKWFYNMRIAGKLLLGFMFVAILAGAVGLFGIMNLQTIELNDSDLYDKCTVPIAQISDISTAFQRTRVNIRDAALATTDDDINGFITSLNDRKKEIDALVPEIGKTLLTKEGEDEYKILVSALVTYYATLDKEIAFVKNNDDQDAIKMMAEEAEGGIASRAVQNSITKLNNLKDLNAKQKADNNKTTGDSARITMVVIVAVAVAVAIILGILISNMISKPVNKLVAESDKLAKGDLNIEIEANTKDEVGALAQAFKTASNNINEAMTNINSASEQVASGAKQVSDSSMALSQGATEQASSIEQLTASLEEISSQTKLNAQNANQANELAETARLNAVQGNTQMKEMLKAMEEINDSSANISKIIKVIDEIAFQTNILALNAAVEAARAGQHGKGFAVVAEEVRNLAARSANAAKETTDMIEGSIKKVEGGTKIANETATALNKIVDGVAKAAALVGDIAVASNEQASGIAQINQGIMQVSQVVQTNSATSQESAAASEELSSQAELLRESVSKFKLKKINQSYGKLGEFNPEVLKMLEDMSDRKKVNSSHADHYKTAALPAKTKIALSDKEFGKY